MGPAWGIACCVLVGWGLWDGGALAMDAVFGQKGPPSVFPLPWSRSQGVLGCVSRAINFSSILEMTFGGISTLSLGGGGWPISLLTRPWELPLPCLRSGDLLGLKIPRVLPPTPTPCLRFTRPQTDWMKPTHFHSPHIIHSFSYTGLNPSN